MNSTYQKNLANRQAASMLSVGNVVRVIKTGEIGVVTGIYPFKDKRYNYSSIGVFFERAVGFRKRYRKFSATSLQKLS